MYFYFYHNLLRYMYIYMYLKLHVQLHIHVQCTCNVCRKFELTLNSIFELRPFKKTKIPKAIVHGFPKNGSEITTNFYYIF